MKTTIALTLLSSLIFIVIAQHDHHHVVDYYSHPHYEYHYGVHDPHHHDVHEQWEKRDGDKVHGHYSLKQPDGRHRIVEYKADKHGANYKVKYEGHAIHELGHHGGGGGGGGGHHHGEGGSGGGGDRHHEVHVGHGHHGKSFIQHNQHIGHHYLVKAQHH